MNTSVSCKESLVKVINELKSLGNKWTSVKERPISKIFIENGIHPDDYQTVFKALCSIGLTERNGALGGLKYKLKEDNLKVDSSILAGRVLDFMTSEPDEYTKVLYRKPYQPRKQRKKEVSVPQPKRKVHALFDQVYFIYQEEVMIGTIIGMKANLCNDKVEYTVQITQTANQLDDIVSYTTYHVYSSIELLFKSLQTRFNNLAKTIKS